MSETRYPVIYIARRWENIHTATYPMILAALRRHARRLGQHGRYYLTYREAREAVGRIRGYYWTARVPPAL